VNNEWERMEGNWRMADGGGGRRMVDSGTWIKSGRWRRGRVEDGEGGGWMEKGEGGCLEGVLYRGKEEESREGRSKGQY
jgi:hypothetical protein